MHRVSIRMPKHNDSSGRPSFDRGQGQSGYAAGRSAEDRSLPGQPPGPARPRGQDDDAGLGLDDRFTGRSGAGEDRGFGGAEDRGYQSGYDHQGDSAPTTETSPAADGDDGAAPGTAAAEGYGAQGPGQGHTGGGASPSTPAPVGGYRSGQWGVGHQGANAEIGGHHAIPHDRASAGDEGTDDRIREDVREALTEHAAIDAREIDVVVHHGEVTLRGAVPDHDTRQHAEDTARRCVGVRDVLDQLVVRGAPGAIDTATHRA